jgi:hypothetical protein
LGIDQVMKLKNIVLSIAALSVITSCNNNASLKGKWQYAGGIYDGKKEGTTEGYKLERNYTDKDFEAFMIEGDATPERYQAGNYKLKGDSCIETETFSTQVSKLTNVDIHYIYQLTNDSLIFKGTLPTGVKVEEYWTKVK